MLCGRPTTPSVPFPGCTEPNRALECAVCLDSGQIIVAHEVSTPEGVIPFPPFQVFCDCTLGVEMLTAWVKEHPGLRGTVNLVVVGDPPIPGVLRGGPGTTGEQQTTG